MEAGAELVSVQAQLQQLRAELGLAPASPSRSAPASTSAHRRSSDPDSHNADTFGSEAQNEEADDAVNDETFGLEATYETRHDAHNEETFGDDATYETRDDAHNEETFGGEATYETRDDAHNEDTFGEAAQNESIDDAANDETFGQTADDEVTFAARPPAAGQWGSHAISALAEAFEDERGKEESQLLHADRGNTVEALGIATSSASAAVVALRDEMDDASVDPHTLLSAWVQQGVSLLMMLSAHPTNASSARAATSVALAAVNALVEELPGLKVSTAQCE